MISRSRSRQLVEEMVDKGVHFDDAVREFEKRFISRVLGQLRRQPHQDRRRARHAPQHPHPEDGRVQDQDGRLARQDCRPATSCPPARQLSTPRLTLPAAAI